MAIYYFKEDITIDLRHLRSYKNWLLNVALDHNNEVGELNYIFCSDDYLLAINIEYLSHDTYTDIITFDNRDNKEEAIAADIFISIDRIKENANVLNLPFATELARVMAHGLLHLMGYKDKSPKEKELMRRAEDKALASFK